MVAVSLERNKVVWLGPDAVNAMNSGDPSLIMRTPSQPAATSDKSALSLTETVAMGAVMANRS